MALGAQGDRGRNSGKHGHNPASGQVAATNKQPQVSGGQAYCTETRTNQLLLAHAAAALYCRAAKQTAPGKEGRP